MELNKTKIKQFDSRKGTGEAADNQYDKTLLTLHLNALFAFFTRVNEKRYQ